MLLRANDTAKIQCERYLPCFGVLNLLSSPLPPLAAKHPWVHGACPAQLSLLRPLLQHRRGLWRNLLPKRGGIGCACCAALREFKLPLFSSVVRARMDHVACWEELHCDLQSRKPVQKLYLMLSSKDVNTKSSGQNAWQPLGQRHLLGFCNCCAAQAVHLSHISTASREYIGMRTSAVLGYEKSSM